MVGLRNPGVVTDGSQVYLFTIPVLRPRGQRLWTACGFLADHDRESRSASKRCPSGSFLWRGGPPVPSRCQDVVLVLSDRLYFTPRPSRQHQVRGRRLEVCVRHGSPPPYRLKRLESTDPHLYAHGSRAGTVAVAIHRQERHNSPGSRPANPPSVRSELPDLGVRMRPDLGVNPGLGRLPSI